MSWTLVVQIAILIITGGYTISSVVTDIQKRHAAGRLELAKTVLAAQAETRKANTERMPWDAR